MAALFIVDGKAGTRMPWGRLYKRDRGCFAGYDCGRAEVDGYLSEGARGQGEA